MTTKPKVPMPPPGLCVYPDKSRKILWDARYDCFVEAVFDPRDLKTIVLTVRLNPFAASSILYRIWMDIAERRNVAFHMIKEARFEMFHPNGCGFTMEWQDKYYDREVRQQHRAIEAKENAEICRKMGEG